MFINNRVNLPLKIIPDTSELKNLDLDFWNKTRQKDIRFSG